MPKQSFKLHGGPKGVADGQVALGLDEVDEVLEQREAKTKQVENTARQVERATGNTGLADAIRHTPTDWREVAEAAVRALAMTDSVFTIFEITKEPYSVPDPDHPNRWGGLVLSMKAEGVIEQAGWSESERDTSKGSGLKTWRGTPEWKARGCAA